MKGLMAVAATVMLMWGVQAAGAAQDTKPMGKTMTAIGTVKTVGADSIVVTDKDGKDWTFAVDKTTKVFAKGGSHMSDEKKASGEKVNVKYHDMGETKHAASVRVI